MYSRFVLDTIIIDKEDFGNNNVCFNNLDFGHNSDFPRAIWVRQENLPTIMSFKIYLHLRKMLTVPDIFWPDGELECKMLQRVDYDDCRILYR